MPAGGYVTALQLQADKGARYSAIALGFALPISTALDGTLQAVLLLCWLASGGWSRKQQLVRANPVALLALGLFALHAVSVLWSVGFLADDWTYLKKYTALLLIPILTTLFVDERDRRWALIALASGLIVTLALSLALAAGLLAWAGFVTGTPDNATIFKKHIAQNMLMAFGCLLFGVLAWQAKRPHERWLWGAAAALAAFDVLFLVHGRTGYVVLGALALLALTAHLRWRGCVAGAVLLAAAAVAVYWLSPAFNHRVQLAASEFQTFQPGVRQGPIGERLEFYLNTSAIVAERPMLGVGTGGFVRAYARQVEGTSMQATRNPHSQYLLTAAQTGLVGLALLLALFVQHWRTASRISLHTERLLARGVLVATAVGCLFNSALMDHTEGLLFAWVSGVLLAGAAGSRRAA